MMRSIVAVSLVLLACNTKSMATSAKEDFAKRYSCPNERVDVKERKDIDAAALLAPDTDVPADEVKKDPARLAKWQADHEEARAKVESGYRRSFTIYEAKGCDHDVLLACTNADSAGQAGATVVVCQEKPLTAASPR